MRSQSPEPLILTNRFANAKFVNTFVSCRKKEFEAALKSQHWRVKSKDIKFMRKMAGSRRSLRVSFSGVASSTWQYKQPKEIKIVV